MDDDGSVGGVGWADLEKIVGNLEILDKRDPRAEGQE